MQLGVNGSPRARNKYTPPEISGLGQVVSVTRNRRVRQLTRTAKNDEIGLAARHPASAYGDHPRTASHGQRPDPA